jgi:hypothetical protein
MMCGGIGGFASGLPTRWTCDHVSARISSVRAPVWHGRHDVGAHGRAFGGRKYGFRLLQGERL